MDLRFTRPVRAAAQLLNAPEDFVEQLFKSSRVLVRLEEDGFIRSPDARETFLLAVSQTLRFCPNTAVCLPSSAVELLEQCNSLASEIYGTGHLIERVDSDSFSDFSAIVNIGTEVLADLPSTTVNSTGWVARVCSDECKVRSLHWEPAPYNPIGAHAAACLGVSQAFLHLINKPRVHDAFEVSLLNLECAIVGVLYGGPSLPSESLDLDAWLIGCGAVANGWAYTVKRLPIKGCLRAVDRQSLRGENFGSYVASSLNYLDKPKVELIRGFLSPSITVTTYPDEWELFKIRLQYELSVPSLIIGGLDNVETRHSVQRLWPRTLIDMAAGGFTSQVILKNAGIRGLCLLKALEKRQNEPTYSERVSHQTGLTTERILKNPTDPITEADVVSAPEELQGELKLALERGELICGRIRHHNLSFETNGSDFAPAVPFVTCFSGVVGAAETMKWLMSRSNSESLHFQYSFESGRGRAFQMDCAPDCECNQHTHDPQKNYRRG